MRRGVRARRRRVKIGVCILVMLDGVCWYDELVTEWCRRGCFLVGERFLDEGILHFGGNRRENIYSMVR